MRNLLLFLIKLYWYFWEEKERRNCIFQKSCSKYIYKITKEQGSIAGLQALKKRFYKCRPGYNVYSEKGKIFVQLADGSTINEQKASSDIISPYKKSITEFEESLNRGMHTPEKIS